MKREEFMSLKKIVILTIFLLTLAGSGYAGTQYYLDYVKAPEVTPARVVERYFTALQSRDYQQAYALVSLDYYHESINQFVDRVSMYAPNMVLETTAETIEENTAVVDVHLVIPMRFGTYESDSTMQLVRAKRVWQIIHP